MRIFAAILLLLTLPGPVVTTVSGRVAAAADENRPRVILRVNRNRTVSGHVEYEDDDIIVVRKLRPVDDPPESFVKSRIAQIVRLVDPEPGQRGRVVLRNGQIRDGVIVEDAFEYVDVEIEGIRARLKREVVDHLDLEPTFDERYERFKASLRPGMNDERMRLCKWLVGHKRYTLAHAELTTLLDHKPEHVEASRLMTVVEAQLAMRPGDDPDSDDAASDDGTMPEPLEAPDPARDEDDGDRRRPAAAARRPDGAISHEEVNLIRVYEIDFDHPPNVAIHQDVVRRLVGQYRTSPLIPEDRSGRSALFRADAIDIARLMFELRAREMYPSIQVLTEPYALNLFRTTVHDTWLMNSCATSRCHGGGDGGRFQLHRRFSKDRRVRYSNLLIIERLELDPNWPLVNYDDPGLSLLIQYGLPRDQARLAHPDVRGWKPIFGRRNDRLRGQAITWIESMMQPRPVYPVDLDPNAPAVDGTEEPG